MNRETPPKKIETEKDKIEMYYEEAQKDREAFKGHLRFCSPLKVFAYDNLNDFLDQVGGLHKFKEEGAPVPITGDDEKKYFISVMKDVRQNEQGGIEIDRTINTIAVDFIKKYKKAMSEASTDVQNKLVELEQEVNKKSEEGKVIDIAALFNDIYQLEKSTMEEMAAAKDANVKNSILRKVSQESELAA